MWGVGCCGRWRLRGFAELNAGGHLGVGEVHRGCGVYGYSGEGRAGGGVCVAEEAAIDPGVAPDGGGELFFVREPTGVLVYSN